MRLLFGKKEKIFPNNKNRGILMKKKEISKIGGASGILNGLFGSGGGTVAVPLLKKSGLSQKEAQATSLMMMFFLSAVSAGIYFFEGHLSFSDAAGFIPGGIAGAVFAPFVFKKIKPVLLRKIFGGFVIFSAAKMLWGIVSEWIL